MRAGRRVRGDASRRSPVVSGRGLGRRRSRGRLGVSGQGAGGADPAGRCRDDLRDRDTKHEPRAAPGDRAGCALGRRRRGSVVPVALGAG